MGRGSETLFQVGEKLFYLCNLSPSDFSGEQQGVCKNYLHIIMYLLDHGAIARVWHFATAAACRVGSCHVSPL